MSRVYFHSQTGEAELEGTERGHMHVVIQNLLLTALHNSIALDGLSDPSPLRRVVTEGYWLNDFRRNMPTALFVSSGMPGSVQFVIDGQRHCPWGVALNTALAIGSDPLKLFARIDGQCESHAYIRGPNRNWVARIIEIGLASGLYRENQGWDGVIALLRFRDDEAVVLSYSVCRQFPNPYVAGLKDEATDDDGDDAGWHGLTRQQQWDLAFAKLVESPNHLEIGREGWNAFRYDGGLNAFQVLAKAEGLEAETKRKGAK